MASPLTQAGAISNPSRFAPIYTNRFVTGLWTQRSPLRDAAVPYIYEKFYAGSRFDSLIGGVNTEISARLTLRRRSGHTEYNDQDFPEIDRFYEFRTFSAADEMIRVMADTATEVYDATGPSTKNLIFTKSAGAGKSTFQSVGNSLYFGNGVDRKKWIQSAKRWIAGKTFLSGDFLVDSNNNLQVAMGARTATIASISITGNVATIFTSDRSTLKFFAGMSVLLAGITTAGFLNAQTVVLTSVGYNQFSFAFVHADYPIAADTGTAACAGGASGGAPPIWSAVLNGITVDGLQQWLCKGNSVVNWGLTPAAAAPTAANSPRPTPFNAWAANTVYTPSLTIVDSNGNVQKLTQGGLTGGAEPVWDPVPGNITNDNTVRWLNMGTANWQAAHAYAVGDLISVTWTVYVIVRGGNVGGHGQQVQDSGDSESYEITYSAMFECTTAGNSGAAQPKWQDGIGTTVRDGTVTWTNQGDPATWLTLVGANTLISLDQTIIDANGYKQQITTPGKSGAAAPVWSKVLGVGTIDNAAVWLNVGPFSAPGTADYLYSFAPKNSVTGTIGSESPISTPIRLGVAQLIVVQGAGFADTQVDTIQIYRTAQGGASRLLLDEIQAFPNTAWTYVDASADAALNVTSQANTNGSGNPPVDGAVNLEFHLQRIFFSQGNTVYYTTGPDLVNGNGYDAVAPQNFFIFPSKVTRLWATTIGLLVFTVSDIYIILGRGISTSLFYDTKYLEGIGLLSYDAFAVNGSTPSLLTTAKKLISLDPGAGLVELGFPIGDQFQAFYDAAETHVTWHEGSSADSALYVADGADGWFRMSIATAPETGQVWSPRALLACTAVKSVEVLPGVTKLLVAPAGGGPILQRDDTVSTDDGVPYEAYADIGNIVLAQPGQVAEIQFFTTDSVAVGKQMTLGVLLGEVSGAFETLRWNVGDPPLLPQSTTLFSDRYYFSQTQSPSYCRHFQLRFQWAKEDAANELLAYTIYGAIHNEKRSQ